MAKTLIGNIKGPAGADGKNGSNGVTPHIGSNGNWWIGTTDTGISATGPAGKDGQDGGTGPAGKDGSDGQPGAAGKDGKDGASASIETEPINPSVDFGYRFTIKNTDSEGETTVETVEVRHGTNGSNGQNGDSVSIETEETDDGYNLNIRNRTYTDLGYSQTTETVSIKHGKDGSPGAPGADGKNGSNGVTPHIGANGNWYIGTVDTGVSATGPAGKDGSPGKDGQDGQDGSPGADGKAAGIKEVTASVDGAHLAQPTVTVTAGGSAQERTFHFAFSGLRGASGEGGGGSGGAQGNWAENDPYNASHIANRTHWKEEYDGPEGEVIAETAVSFTSNIKSITGAMSNGIQVGGKYIVTWDGTDYVCVGKTCSDGNYIGNASFMNAGNISFADTGEPFLIQQFTGTYYALWKADKTAETITVKVVGVKETVWHKLDKGYLDEALQFGSETAEILPETTVEIDPDSGSYEGVADVPLTVGETYTVKYNGVDYPCVCSTMDLEGVTAYVLGNLGAMMGEEGTGEPFVIVVIPDMGSFGVYALDGSESVTLSITGKVVKPIDPKYLPEGLPYFETGMVDILPEAVYEIDPDSGSYEGVADVPLTVGKTYTVKYNGVDYPCVCSTMDLGGVTAYALGNLSAMMGEGDTGEPFVFLAIPDAGSFGLYPLDGSAFVTLSIRGEIKVVHKLAAEYMTEGIPYAEPFDDVIMAAWPSSIQSDGSFTDPADNLVAGNVYKVNWGGTIYECVAREVAIWTETFVALGHGIEALGDSFTTADPFGIVILPISLRAQYGFTGIITGGTPENNEFSITGGLKVQKINEYCLPDSTQPLFVKLRAQADGVFTPLLDTTYDEVSAAICGATPRMVYLAETSQAGFIRSGSKVYSFSHMNGSAFYFQCISAEFRNDTPILRLSVIVWDSDNTISLHKSIDLTT